MKSTNMTGQPEWVVRLSFQRSCKHPTFNLVLTNESGKLVDKGTTDTAGMVMFMNHSPVEWFIELYVPCGKSAYRPPSDMVLKLVAD